MTRACHARPTKTRETSSESPGASQTYEIRRKTVVAGCCPRLRKRHVSEAFRASALHSTGYCLAILERPGDFPKPSGASRRLPKAFRSVPDRSGDVPGAFQSVPETSQSLPESPRAFRRRPKAFRSVSETSPKHSGASKNVPDTSKSLPERPGDVPKLSGARYPHASNAFERALFQRRRYKEHSVSEVALSDTSRFNWL